MVHWGAGLGFDYEAFRSAALVLAHGGNLYDPGQIWHMENALYNQPAHLGPGDMRYHHLGLYYNPPLFAAILMPLARLPHLWGYGLYSMGVLACAMLGTWLTLAALDWPYSRTAAIAVASLTTPVFLTLWFGQLAAFLLCILAGAMLCLRRGYPACAGGLMALGLVKPHLMLPVAVLTPFLLASPVARRRYVFGYTGIIGCAMVLTVLTTGAGSLMAWMQTLIHLSGTVETVQNNLPSLGGLLLNVLPQPWNRLLASLLTILTLAVMIFITRRARTTGRAAWEVLPLLMVLWIAVTPYVHTPDQTLFLPALALVWRSMDAKAAFTPPGALRPSILPILALWAFTLLPFSYVLAAPWRYLDLLPSAIILIALVRNRHPLGSRQPKAHTVAIYT